MTRAEIAEMLGCYPKTVTDGLLADLNHVKLEQLPESLRGEMARYLALGIVPGDFLWAVIQDKGLVAVANHADSQLISRALPEIARWFYWECPGNAHHEKNALAWVEMGGLVGQELRDREREAAAEAKA